MITAVSIRIYVSVDAVLVYSPWRTLACIVWLFSLSLSLCVCLCVCVCVCVCLCVCVRAYQISSGRTTSAPPASPSCARYTTTRGCSGYPIGKASSPTRPRSSPTFVRCQRTNLHACLACLPARPPACLPALLTGLSEMTVFFHIHVLSGCS